MLKNRLNRNLELNFGFINLVTPYGLMTKFYEKQNEQCEITKRKVLFKSSHAKGHRGEIQEKGFQLMNHEKTNSLQTR